MADVRRGFRAPKQQLGYLYCVLILFSSLQMILRKADSDEQYTGTFDFHQKNKFPNRQKFSFRTTTYSTRKNNVFLDNEKDKTPLTKKCSASPQKNNQPSPTKALGGLVEKGCTNFMKSYVQKLKRQRKRQSKKQVLSHSNKESLANVSGVNYDQLICPLANNYQKMLVLERIPNFSINLNRTFVSGDSESPDCKALGSERMMQIIRQIKRVKNGLQMKAVHQSKKQLFEDVFPLITHRSATKNRNRGSHRKTILDHFNFRSLEPWEHDKQIPEFSIQEF